MYLRNSVKRGAVAIVPASRYLLRSATAPKASCANTTTRSLSSAASATAADSYDVIIIGAGVIGNSCALQLNRKGYRTLNIDKGPAAGSGSTSYSSGNLRSMC